MLTLIKDIPELTLMRSGSMINFKTKGTGKTEIRVSSTIKLNRIGISSSLNTNNILTELIMENEKIDKMIPSSDKEIRRSTKGMSNIKWEIFKINTCNSPRRIILMPCTLMMALEGQNSRLINNR